MHNDIRVLRKKDISHGLKKETQFTQLIFLFLFV